MKIKLKIVLLFTGLVTAILFILCLSIYFISVQNRQTDFRTRLKNRAITTMSLLRKVPEINNELLQRIDELTLVALQQRSVMVYANNNKVIYQYTDDNTVSVVLNNDIKEKVLRLGEYFFTVNAKDAIALNIKGVKNNYIIVSAAYDKDGFEKNRQLTFILIFSFLFGVLITFISGLFFSERLVKPIKKITLEVKEISSNNLSKRVPVTEQKDELNELSKTFNELLSRLQESFEIQKRFIANASHELSTPLTAILSQLEITLQKERTDSEYKELIKSVYDDVIHLTQLTKGLLEIAKASGSFAGAELKLLRVDELLLKLPYTIKKEDSRYKVNLHFDTFPDVDENVLIEGNENLLFSAIKNIVQNACKYSPDHEASVSLHFASSNIKIIIIDKGPGIQEKDIPFLFQPFYRGKTSMNSSGFGLGLSLANEIITIHKGSIYFENLPQKGSSFKIILPLAKKG